MYTLKKNNKLIFLMCKKKFIGSLLGTFSGTLSSFILTSALTEWDVSDDKFIISVICGGLSGGCSTFFLNEKNNENIVYNVNAGLASGFVGSYITIKTLNHFSYKKVKCSNSHKCKCKTGCTKMTNHYNTNGIELNFNQQKYELLSKIDSNLKSLESKNKMIENQYLQMSNDFMDMKTRMTDLQSTTQLTIDNKKFNNTSDQILNGTCTIFINNIGINEVTCVYTLLGKLCKCYFTITDQFKINNKEGIITIKNTIFTLDSSFLKNYKVELILTNKSINRTYTGLSDIMYTDANNNISFNYKFDDSTVVPLYFAFQGVLNFTVSYYIL